MRTKSRSVRVDDDLWAEIGRRAAAGGESIAVYLTRRGLEDEGALRRALKDVDELLEQALDRVREAD